MKYLFFILLFLAALPTKAQKKKTPIIDLVDTQNFRGGDTAWIRGDTVEFNINTTLRYIKIGNEVYEIVKHNPTIEKVKPAVNPLWQWQQSWPNNIQPIYNGK